MWAGALVYPTEEYKMPAIRERQCLLGIGLTFHILSCDKQPQLPMASAELWAGPSLRLTDTAMFVFGLGDIFS